MIVCLFDIDGTLLSSGGAGKHALETALTEEFQIELREAVPYSGRTDRAIIRDLFRLHAIADTPANLQRIFAGYLGRLPASLNTHRGRVLPGIAELLAGLGRQAHIALGLLTGNVRAGARAKLGHFGMADHFPFGGFGDDHFDRDDVAREALTAVHHHLGRPIRPECIWVIGDTPLDVRCARAIGARAVAVATGLHTVADLADSQPDLVVADFSNPALLLDRLAG